MIAKKANYGFIITNWHVICDSNGYVTVRFPNKREYPAAVIAVDDRWDLALLVITEPKDVTPVVISPTIPKIDEYYWVAGYRGDGTYRIRGGRCLAFQYPEGAIEPELIEIGVPSEGGDSGGPIFNGKQQLSGVLFGSDSMATVGSHCGRVITFLNQAAPQVARLPADPKPILEAAARSQKSILERGGHTAGSAPGSTSGNLPNNTSVNIPRSGPGLTQSSVSSSMSFGGGSIRPRNRLQETSLTQHHGFLYVHYETVPVNDPANDPVNHGTLFASRSGAAALGASTSDSSSTWGTETIPASANTASTNATSGTTAAAISSSGYTSAYPSQSHRTETASTSTPNTGTVSTGGFFSPPQKAASQPPTSQPFVVAPTAVTTGVVSPQPAATSPGYSGLSGVGTYSADQASSSRENAAPLRSASGLYNASTFQQTQETAPGGTRSGTNTGTSGSRNSSSGDYYNSYGSQKPPQSISRDVADSYWSHDDEMASGIMRDYSLDSAEMRADGYTSKYGDEYSAEVGHEPGTVAPASKSDAIKIVIAILVIFFILFHTIKTMAIAEEKSNNAFQ